MTRSERHITHMIAAIRRRWFGRQISHFTVIAAAGLIAWMLAMVVIDNLAMLTSTQLLLGWALLVGGYALWTVAISYIMTVGRPAPTDLALMYERRVPGQHNRLINAVQLILDRRADRDPMALAVVTENAAALDPATTAQAIDFRPVRAALIAAGIALVLLMGYTAIRPGWAFNALARVIQPFSPPQHLLATDPTATPGDTELIEGRALTITAALRADLPASLRPDKVQLEYRVGKLGWSDATMTADDDGRYAYRFEAVWHPMTYRIRAGRSVSPLYQVAIRYRPRVEQLQVSVTPPAYVSAPTTPLKPNVGDVTALAGSRIEVKLRASAALSGGRIELSDGTPIPLTIAPDDAAYAWASFALDRSGSYAIRLTDTEDLENLNPPRYTLTAEPDQPPVVVVTRPGRDLILPVNGLLDLAIEANDDIGLADVAVQIRTAGSQWQDVQRWPVHARSITHRTYVHSISLRPLGLKVNDVLLYRVAARDYRRPEPNVGLGRTWSVTIAERSDEQSILLGEHKRLLAKLKAILALQVANRGAVDLDREVAPIAPRQERVRQMTVTTIDAERKSIRPTQTVIDELVLLADGPMLRAIQLTADYRGTYQQREPKKQPVLAVMDVIIARLEEMIGRISRSITMAEEAEERLAQLDPAEREQALKQIHDMLAKLRQFIPEQDQVIADTEELVRKGDNLTHGDLQKIDALRGTEDKWAEVMQASVKDIHKLTEQGFADESIANDYKEMVEQIEEASKNLNPKLITLAVPREQAGREMAESLVEEMEMWLPSSPDHIKWVMEEPLDKPEIPMVDLPDQLSDLIGELIEDQDELNDAAEDQTSAWADSIAEGAGWGVAGGPISNFSAVGKTGNQLPDNNEISGRSGEGRSGRSQGQMVEDVAKGLAGRSTPTRITNDPYEQGVVKELQQMPTGGATGGGKARGSGQEGLQGQAPPPTFEDLKFMSDWQKRIRAKAQRVAGQLKMVHINAPDLAPIIDKMKDAEQQAVEGRYVEMFKTQQMVMQQLQMAQDLTARSVAMRVDRAYYVPPDQRTPTLDAGEEPVPQEYRDAVQRYFQLLSESE